MKIDRSFLEKLAHLSRLHIKEEEADTYLEDVNKAVEWVSILQEIDTQDVPAVTHMTEEKNVFREDRVEENISSEQGLRNAKNKDSYYFKVPRVVDKEKKKSS